MTTEVHRVNTTSPPLLPRETGIAFCAALLAEMGLILIGNSIAFGAFTRPRQLRRRSFYLLINLTVADFLVGAVCIPFEVYLLAKHFQLWPFDRSPQTELAYQTLALFTVASIMSLVMISFERMVAIVWPIKHRTLSTKVYHALASATWAFAFMCSAFDIMCYHQVITELAGVVNWLILLTLGPLLILLNYLSIWIKCRFRAPPNNKASGRERRLAKSLFLLTMVSLVTILPAPMIYVYFYFAQEEHFAGCAGTCRILYMSAQVLSYSNSLVNPIIYAFGMPEVREYAVQLICRRSNRRQPKVVRMRSMEESTTAEMSEQSV